MYTRNFYNKNLRMVARELRKNMTVAENKPWYEFLRSLWPRARRQRTLGNFIVDFYVPKAKLIIEVDGDIHDDEPTKLKDADRTRLLERSGIHIIRFKNNEIVQNFPLVCKIITDQIALRTKV